MTATKYSSVLHSTTGQLSIPARERGPESRTIEKRRGNRGVLPESNLRDELWMRIEELAREAYGRDTGRDVFRALRVGEHDHRFFYEVVLGVKPLAWQLRSDELLEQKPYLTVAGSNSLGKTTDLVMKHLRAPVYRLWAPEWWDVWQALHHGPLEEHALQARTKTLAILRGEAREQAYKVKGGWKYRPCLLEPFVRAVKADEGKHEALEFFDGWSNLIYRSTAFKAKGSDGSAPHLITEDELRYEQNLTHVVEFVFIPRSIRAPGMRMYLPITHLEASVEAVALEQRGINGDQDWNHLDLDITANDRLDEESKARAERNLSKRARKQVLGGKAIQPMGAKFSHDSIQSALYGGREPEWLDDLTTARTRAEERCVLCIARREKRQEVWTREQREHEEHLLVGAIDPASSAGYDAIPATVWDLEPFGDAARGADVVYIEELEPGTPIQGVAKHMVHMARVLRCEIGYDAKGPLGHAVKDQLVELDPDGEYVECRWNQGEEKDEALDFFAALIDGGLWHCPEHTFTRSQITNYVRKDAKIPTDFIMVQVLAAQVARPYLQDTIIATRAGETFSAEQFEEPAYAGIDEASFDDPYMAMLEPLEDESR